MIRSKIFFYSNKQVKSISSAIAEHFLNNSDCARSFSDSNYSLISKARSDYHVSVLESLFIIEKLLSL